MVIVRGQDFRSSSCIVSWVRRRKARPVGKTRVTNTRFPRASRGPRGHLGGVEGMGQLVEALSLSGSDDPG
jgi:hypothetical protein